MCAVCRKNPCDSRCPNAEEPSPVYTCEWCKEQGMKSLLKKTENNEGSYGANEICNLIEDCMANNWKGIIWKILEERKLQRPATRTEQIQQRVSEVDSW